MYIHVNKTINREIFLKCKALYYFLCAYEEKMLKIPLCMFSQHFLAEQSIKCYTFLLHIFSSPELKAQVSFSDHLLSGVCLSLCLSVCKLFTFSTSSPDHWANFNQTWHKASLGEGDLSLFKFQSLNKGPRPFPRGDNYEIGKVHQCWRNLEIVFSRTTGPISTKLGTKHPLVKGTQGFPIRTIQVSKRRWSVFIVMM